MKPFVLGLLFLPLSSHAQKNDLFDFLGGKSIVDSATVDLNGDRLKDLAIVAYASHNTSAPNREKQFAVFFGKADKTYRKMLQTSNLFGDSTCCGVMGRDPYTGLRVKKSSFVIEFATGGSSHRDEVSYSFKFQNDSFYCVAFESWEYDQPLNENTLHVSQADYITGISQEYDIEGDKKVNVKKNASKPKPLQTINDIKCPFSCE